MSKTPPPSESPFVLIPGYVSKSNPPEWGAAFEANILLVLEANRRFLGATQDPRLAATLTLSWAMLLSGAE